ncbi:PD-(D/E)XK nuclease family protein [Candidatus Daviesbacteria bacterium]|nr:PD-(D/E)XK nuclease family protein [Candidatus Daviesbacteria bacterium]
MVPSSKNEYIKNALFISYTSLSDFIKCPRSFYLKHVYRDPQKGYKLQIISPFLTLGSTVHDTIKWYLEAPTKPTREQTLAKFRNFWRKYRLQKGGFNSLEEEVSYGQRGLKMLENFLENAEILEPCAPFVSFPKFRLVDNIILMGNFDFVGQCSDGSLHIVDFKTGAKDENDSLQLHIYAILAEANFQKPVSKISFWYLDRESGPREVVLDSLEPKIDWLKQKGLEMKKALQEDSWVCKDSSKGTLCRDCSSYQMILDGKAQFLFQDYRYKKLIYFLRIDDS